MSFNIACIGELLIDCTPAGASERGNSLFEANPGGGVANFAVAAAYAGSNVSFIGKVGDDPFGHVLSQALSSRGVDTTGLVLSKEYQTTLAFVSLKPDGDREFSFYRRNGADAMLTTEDINKTVIRKADLLHVSSLTMTNEAAKVATHAAVDFARSAGVIVTYDPNWRPLLWDSPQMCKENMYSMIPKASIVKISNDELEYIMGSPIEAVSARHMLKLGPKLIIVTRGAAGCGYYWMKGSGNIPAQKVEAVDTTGAGDCFFGNFVSKFLDSGLDINNITNDDLPAVERCLRYATAAAALCVQCKGAMPAMPKPEQVFATLG